MASFNKAFLDFFKELSENNSSEWFNANRKRYEQHVKKPFAAFTDEMIKLIGEKDPAVRIKASEAIFRINRDIRFAADKRPYNEHVSANISPMGRKSHEFPGFYYQFSPKGVMIGGGAYMVEKETLYAIRELIAGNPEKFESLLNEKEFKAKYKEIQGEKNKIIPKEFKEAVLTQPLIANKQFYYMAELKPDFVLQEDLPQQMMEYYKASLKMNNFLQQAMRVSA